MTKSSKKSHNGAVKHECALCGKTHGAYAALPIEALHSPLKEMVLERCKTIPPLPHVCMSCLDFVRIAYIDQELTEEGQELRDLSDEVSRSLTEEETLAENINTAFDQKLTLGQRVADLVAEFGGSWWFLFSFAGFLALWIALNIGFILYRPFDPFPFILLNLILSCLASVQAPVIMMSQKRLEQRDRLRSENDYRINLKAELEIRHLHAKLDLLLTKHWKRLVQIQKIQTDMLQELLHQRAN